MRYIVQSACGLFFAAFVFIVTGLPVTQGQPPRVPPQQPLPDANAAAVTANVSGENVLTRGPLHEAFAEPINLSGAIPPVVERRPPDPIDETPAAYQPEGEDAVWIPGYWDWDDQRGDFIWVSGIWRSTPPDHQWIGGYWVQSEQGYQRTPGFWTSADTQEVQYFPQPPAAQEQGPSTEQPSADAMWVPGYWTWRGNGFTWMNGFWTVGRSGWVWTPTSYSWTPRGFVLVNGFWDYDLGHRGLVFAPVAFTQAVYQQPGFVYTPSVVINPSILSFYLFARPTYGQYYFGDYFGAEYDRLGFYPWYGVNRVAGYQYDPLFAYDRWYYASRDPHWIQNLERWHTYYRDHPDARPPHDYVAEQRLAGDRTDRADRRFLSIGQPVNTIARNSSFPVRVAPVTAADRTRALDIARSHQAFQTQRSRMEAATARTTAPGKATLPQREHAIVGQRTTPSGIGVPRSEPGRTPSNMTGERQSSQPREAYKPVLPGGETQQPVNPSRERPDQIRPEPQRPEPQPKPNQDFRGNPEPIHPQPEQRRPEIQPQSRQPQPQTTPRHPEAPNVVTPGRSETHQPAPRPEATRPAPRPEASRPAPRPEASRPTPRPEQTQPPRPDHNQPAPARGNEHDKEKKPGNG